MEKIISMMWISFIEHIERARNSRGQLANIAKMCGVGRGSVTKWANGDIKSVDVHDFAKYCDALGIKIQDYISTPNIDGIDFEHITKLQSENADLITQIVKLEAQKEELRSLISELVGQPEPKAPAQEASGKDAKFYLSNGTEGE